MDGAEAGIVDARPPTGGRRTGRSTTPAMPRTAGKVLSRDEQAEVPAGHYTHVLLTKDFNPLEPRALEYKLYAKGVGQVLAVGVSGDTPGVRSYGAAVLPQ